MGLMFTGHVSVLVAVLDDSTRVLLWFHPAAPWPSSVNGENEAGDVNPCRPSDLMGVTSDSVRGHFWPSRLVVGCSPVEAGVLLTSHGAQDGPRGGPAPTSWGRGRGSQDSNPMSGLGARARLPWVALQGGTARSPAHLFPWFFHGLHGTFVYRVPSVWRAPRGRGQCDGREATVTNQVHGPGRAS